MIVVPHINLNCKFILTLLGGFGSGFALAAYCNSSQGGIDISRWVTEQLSPCPSIEKVKFYTVKLFTELIYRNYAGWVECPLCVSNSALLVLSCKSQIMSRSLEFMPQTLMTIAANQSNHETKAPHLSYGKWSCKINEIGPDSPHHSDGDDLIAFVDFSFLPHFHSF